MTSLARYATEVELVCSEIDNCDGDIPRELIARLTDAQVDLAGKVDRWIGLLDAVKSRNLLLKEHRERVSKAQKSCDSFERSLKDYVKFVIESTPNIPFKGESGSLRLQNNPRAVKVDFELTDKTTYKTVSPSLLQLEPSLNNYVKTVSYVVLDSEKLKSDLDMGIELPWARLEQGKHVRIGT